MFLPKNVEGVPVNFPIFQLWDTWVAVSNTKKVMEFPRIKSKRKQLQIVPHMAAAEVSKRETHKRGELLWFTDGPKGG